MQTSWFEKEIAANVARSTPLVKETGQTEFPADDLDRYQQALDSVKHLVKKNKDAVADESESSSSSSSEDSEDSEDGEDGMRIDGKEQPEVPELPDSVFDRVNEILMAM